MRTTGSLVDGGHGRRCEACRGRLRSSDVGSVAAQSCCTFGTLTLKCQPAGPTRTVSSGMSAAGGPDQSLRRSACVSVAPSMTVNPRTRPIHRARSGHGGLFVPKPSCGAEGQRGDMSDLGSVVHRYPLASIAGDGDRYSLSYSVPACAKADSLALLLRNQLVWHPPDQCEQSRLRLGQTRNER